MIDETTIDKIYPLYLALPEFGKRDPLDAIIRRTGDNYLCLAYTEGNEVVGFKLGYALSASEFYSWIGGVDPAFRGRGIARALLEYQENWARRQGFDCISVKSMNRFIPMMQMLLSSGYRIDGFSPGVTSLDHKIHFRKSLQEENPPQTQSSS